MGDDFLDLAARAANLDERMRIVAALNTVGKAAPQAGLPAFDTWKIGRQAGRLAAKFGKEALHRSAPVRHTTDDIARVLTAYRHHELGLDDADEETRTLFTSVQNAWLPTYQAALDGFDRSARESPDASWRRFDVYYAGYAKACEPFLNELGRRLDAARARHPGLFDRKLTDDLQRHLLGRFELSLAWALEAAGKVHCAERDIDEKTATRADYLAFVEATFADSAAYHRFYLGFPVLGRWLAHVTDLLSDFGCEMIERLATDASAIGEAFFDEEIAAFRSLRLGLSDHHAGARSVVIVEAAPTGGGSASFVYKPRCIRSEAAMQALLARLRDDGVLGFATRPVLPRQAYGYEALIPSGRNRLKTREEVEQVYAELGGYLGIFYVLGGGDLHFENILVADGHAYVCDCETVLGVLPRGQARPLGTLLDSVFKTGLLEWPRTDIGDTEMRVSGYSGGEAYEMPVPVPRVNEHRATFQASVTHQAGVQVEPDGSNRVFLGDTLMQPKDFTDAIMDGFGRVYDWFETGPVEAIRAITEIFDGVSVRFINWGTQIYSQLLVSARHPKCLVDPMEVDLLANTVRTFPRNWDDDGVLAEQEVTSMWRMDVPIFNADIRGGHLVYDHAYRLSTGLDLSPLDYAAQRIRRLSGQNRVQQTQYIAAGLSTAEVSSPAFVTASMDYAIRIGERVCEMLREPSAPAPWTSFEITQGGISEVDVDGDLYHGSAGIALFLAYLDELAPRPEFRRAAERALTHAVETTDRSKAGAYQGLGGLIYLLTHLHHLWQDRGLLELAVRLSDELPGRIGPGAGYDVLNGAAGVIPVLLGLSRATDGRGLDHADLCARTLLRHAVQDGDTLSWPLEDPREAHANLTGFSHGAGGIGWALIQLGKLIDRPDYVSAGRRAFAYEATHFDEAEKDWYDLRTNAGGISRGGRYYANAWCNGAAGIGLARITSWATLGGNDEELLREAHLALAATMRNFPRLKNDTLCHGRTGNAELFLRFGRLYDEPAFQLEANVQVQSQWRHVEDVENGTTRNSAGFFPGLLIGISGFGMHFLRLAHPDRVPSVLLLDPAADRRRDDVRRVQPGLPANRL